MSDATGAMVAANWRAWLGRMAEHAGGTRRRFGRVLAARAGRPELPFDQVFVLEPAHPADVEAALDWVRRDGSRCWIVASSDQADAVERLLAGRGLAAPAATLPGMARALDRPPAPVDDHGVEVRPATSETDLAAVAEVAAAAFELPAEAARGLAAASVADDAALDWYLGRATGAPVACALACRTDDVVGVYGVGVPPDLRRRGLGAAVTRELLAREAVVGARRAVLQASPLGASVFAGLGFREVTRYRLFAVPAP